MAPDFALLRDAAPLIPIGASVVVRTEPADPIAETYGHRFAVALLPGRNVRPAALYGHVAEPSLWRDADYVVVIGRMPSASAGRLLLRTADGTVWRR